MVQRKKNFAQVSKRKFEEGEGRSFVGRVQGKIFKGLVVRKGDKFFAFENLCRHLPIPLDLEDDQFFSHDHSFLQCQMHGALYEINTGKCVGGPCVGSTLRSLVVHEEEHRLLIELPLILNEEEEGKKS